MNKPKAVLIAVDMLRADHLSCYGYPRETSPNIDRLAAEGALFQNCMSAFCCTAPSFTSMLTGKLPLNHGVVVNPWNDPNVRRFTLDDTEPTLAGRLVRAGVTTAAVDNLLNFASHPGWFARGFQYYLNATNSPDMAAYKTRGDAINAMVLPWIRQHAEESFFLFIHYWDVHGPWTQSEEFTKPFRETELPTKTAASGEQWIVGAGPAKNIGPEEKERIDPMDGAIRFVDARVAEVFDTLRETGIYEDTTIILTSDHGRNGFDRWPCWQARGVSEGAVHVPLIVKSPDGSPGSTSDALVHGVDCAPTLVEILAPDAEHSMDGESLLPLLRGETDGRDFVATCGSFAGIPQRTVRTKKWKLVRNYRGAALDLADTYRGNIHGRFKMWLDGPGVELYDLQGDPEESVDLAPAEPSRVKEMEALLDRWIRDHADRPGQPDPLIEGARWGIRRSPQLIN